MLGETELKSQKEARISGYGPIQSTLVGKSRSRIYYGFMGSQEAANRHWRPQ